MAKVKENVDNWKEWLDGKLHEKNAFTNLLEKIEQKTNVQRIYIAYGIIALISAYLMLGYGAQLLCNFIGFVYPAYASIKAIESTHKDDDTQWLMYWVVYSVFALSELFTDIFFFWIPFYWFFKCAFLLWCMAGQTWDGSTFIYYKVVKPVFLKYEGQIDAKLNKAAEYAGTAFEEGKKLAGDAASMAADATAKLQSNKSD